MMTELMQEYLGQSSSYMFASHTDTHSDRDSHFGDGSHTEYDYHTDEDDY